MQMNTDKRNRIIDAMDQEERNILTTGNTGSTGKEKEKFDPLITLITADSSVGAAREPPLLLVIPAEAGIQ